jgi:hypothetical protein
MREIRTYGSAGGGTLRRPPYPDPPVSDGNLTHHRHADGVNPRRRCTAHSTCARRRTLNGHANPPGSRERFRLSCS